VTTANNWTTDVSGDWDTVANWSLGSLPNSSNTVTISTPDVQSIFHSTGYDVISKLTVGTDFFTLSGGTLNILTTASFADGYTQTGGTLIVGAVTITGQAQLLGGGSQGATAFSVTGGGITLGGGYVLGGASLLTVSATANQNGTVTLGDSTGVGAMIHTVSGGTYNIAGDYAVAAGAQSAVFSNAGTLAKSAGSGVGYIGVNLNSSGAISVASGNLVLAGPSNVINGTLSGAGQLTFGGGSSTLGATSTGIATLAINNFSNGGGNTIVNLAANVTYLHTFLDTSNGLTTLNVGAHSFTVAGASATVQGANGAADVIGSGAFVNKSVLTLSNALFGGTIKVSNVGTVNQSGGVIFGDGGGSAPTVTNTSTGVYDLTSDVNMSQNGASVTFVNQGLLEKTGLGGFSLINMGVTNSGTISAQSGVLDFTSALTNTGTIAGAGTVEVDGGGVLTLSAGSVLSVANLRLYFTSVLNVSTSLTYAGTLSAFGSGAAQINLGINTLTLTGSANSIDGGNGVTDIMGPGKIANSGTLSLGDVVIDGTGKVDNTGVVNQNNNITIGGGGGKVASIINEAGATYNLTAAFGISDGAATASHFDNSGTFTAQPGAGQVAVLATTFNNLSGGVVTVGSGALDNQGQFNNAGTISGARFETTGGVVNLNAGSTLTVGQFDMYFGSVVNLGAALTYAGTFIDASSGNTQLNLGANTLTLSGPDVEFNPSNGIDLISGAAGVLKLTSASNFEGGLTEIGGTAQLSIQAAATVTGGLQVGDTSSHAASIVITAAGSYNLTADVGITQGASGASTFTNGGLFEKTGGTGFSIISAKFINNGTIQVTSGTLEFKPNTLVNNGTIIGTVVVDGQGDTLITAASGARAAVVKAHRMTQALASFSAHGAAPLQAGGPTSAIASPMLAATHHRSV
jgi:filamentous hemagglutinin